jgi:NADPH-dependent 2,4-dienoyl-CoA reductase/sulfur reductase-like enzyme/phenylpropionate dioxygenase-like ring-hydroxylating dioxygenase large terminal subunit
MPTINHHKEADKSPSSHTDWIDQKIFSDINISTEEQQKIFKNIWVPVCHESELPEPYDFRTSSIGNENILILRAADNKVHAYLNVCPHRGMLIERRPQGTFLEGQASGNPKRITCMFHAWQFDMKGNCVYVAREKEGYQDRFSKDEAGLRRLRCETKYGGFIWVNMNDKPSMSLDEWVGAPLGILADSLDYEPLEVFHYHKEIIKTNFKINYEKSIKLRNDFIKNTNTEWIEKQIFSGSDISFEEHKKIFKNIEVAFGGSKLPSSKKIDFDYGHAVAGTFGDLNQSGGKQADDLEKLAFPKMKPGKWFMVDLFPGFNFSLHGSALSVSTITPLGPDEVMVEYRGLGLQSDSDEMRSARVKHHNSIWSPFALGGAYIKVGEQNESQDLDQDCFHHYFNEWGRWMKRYPEDYDKTYIPTVSVSVSDESTLTQVITEKPALTGYNVVVVGASHAGINFADKMRKNGFEGNLTILDRQSGGPMERPPLSKAFLVDEEEKINPVFLLRKKKWYKDQNITLKTKTNVQKIDLETKSVVLDGGEKIYFDKLVLSSGAMPRMLPSAIGMKNAFTLRQPADAVAIRDKMNDAKTAIIIGGGYIGLEVAASLRKKGIAVNVIEAADRILARVASSSTADYLSELHTSHGVNLTTGINVEEIIQDGDSFSGVKLSDGTVLNGDMLIVGIGVLPDSKLANEAGLETQRNDGGAILVDNLMYTSHPDVLAIGDVALQRGASIAIESVHNAQETATIAASTLMEVAPPSIQTPWFWSDQYDTNLQSVGVVPVGDSDVYQITRPGSREGGISFWSFRQKNLIAVEVINDPATYMMAKQCLDSNVSPDPDLIADIGYSPLG